MKQILRKIFNFKRPLESYPNIPDMFKDYRLWIENDDVERVSGGFLYKNDFYPDHLFIGGASFAIFDKAKEFCNGVGIDVGAGFWEFPGSTPVDLYRGKGKKNLLRNIEPNSQDYIFSSHCLEHITNWQVALKEWVRKIKPEGILFLYLPHPECKIWHPKSPFVGEGHKWIPEFTLLKNEIERLGLDIVSFNETSDFMQSFYICAKKRNV